MSVASEDELRYGLKPATDLHGDVGLRERVIDQLNSVYLASSAMAALASLRSRSASSASGWLAVSIGIAAVGLLRAGEAALWLDYHLRSEFHVTGWYENRRPLQLGFILAASLALFLAHRRLPTTGERPLSFALDAFYLLAVLAVVRSSSLHWSDAVLEHQLGTVTLSHASQVILLIVISAVAVLNLKRGTSDGALAREYSLEIDSD